MAENPNPVVKYDNIELTDSLVDLLDEDGVEDFNELEVNILVFCVAAHMTPFPKSFQISKL